MKEKRLYIQITGNSERISDHEDFIDYSALVTNLYTFYLPIVLIIKTQKLIIEFSNETNALLISPKEIGESIYTIAETFPFDLFKTCASAKKIELLVDHSYECLLKLYKHLRLDLTNVDFAHHLIKENNNKLSLKLCGGLKHNKNRTFSAIVTAGHFIGYTLIQIAFLDDHHKVIKILPLFKTAPVYFFYYRLAKSAKWMNNDVFEIFNDSKEFCIQVNLNGDYRIIYNPKDRNSEDIREEIRFIAKEVLVQI
ncbi:hypothetical protein [Pedobacter metabolipauper]|uniref:Uncharacterized protein n=1 Tax=Pedobacter metabolipauper TaxID=425513 RepID=A0A4R6SQQ9_9SPHI|nr:hypothetical protein [Pedobacter metabolipauper]TDQ06545.1 hypothetical protein ATK78_4201 [Pedobacter metabolipauper]